MSPTQLVRLSAAHARAWDRLPKGHGGGRPLERAFALAVVAVAIAAPVLIVLCSGPSKLGLH